MYLLLTPTLKLLHQIRFINSIDKLYTEEETGNKIYIGGTGDLILQPEFENPKNFKQLIDLAEDKNLVIHIFENSAKADNEVFISIGNENEEEKDFGKEILPRAISQSRVLSYQYEGYWTDIGNISSFFEANLGLTDEIPKFNMFDSNHAIFTRARMLPPSKISGTSISNNLAKNIGLVLDKIITGVLFFMSTRATTARIFSPFLK